jgi:hypothetical protein
MKKLIAALAISMNLLAANDCPQIDPNVKDPDGMPLCPEAVNQTSAWAVYRCAIEQANSFHAPTAAEKSSVSSLLNAYRNKDINSMLMSSSALSLQMCRAKTAQTSILLAYVKPGVKDYSGPFMMMKETNHSKVILIGPHDDSDGTYADTKKAMVESDAMFLFSNGHKRGHVGTDRTNNGDFVHEPVEQNLGTYAVQEMGRLFPGHVWLHVHGMKDRTKILYRSRSAQLSQAFEKAVMKETRITDFAPLNAYFTVDPLVNTNWYLKTEMPAIMHQGNQHALAKIVRDIEQYDWAK